MSRDDGPAWILTALITLAGLACLACALGATMCARDPVCTVTDH